MNWIAALDRRALALCDAGLELAWDAFGLRKPVLGRSIFGVQLAWTIVGHAWLALWVLGVAIALMECTTWRMPLGLRNASTLAFRASPWGQFQRLLFLAAALISAAKGNVPDLVLGIPLMVVCLGVEPDRPRRPRESARLVAPARGAA